ncbi:multidrug efflux system outer membrane protein [Rhizobium leguminosarum]|jgi:multidrug efflux system outer membrane protein|nr:multidrug efflux system outer membrane protein [Rhizobium leguminosarum]MBB4331353.1 multidrug efflux system outer membrane protein [Rhizobium leguminosarum]MBB4338794.1 multidrug efflux system outer membrane protein [Rhizobium leguminosarum]MBB4356693.1 multidrug efflux system outer membrane protein [Rhizobium leguminosarum]MBB4465638.1 multidrug efflux system outer membrane protein [Rhizobium leguminosarum]
MNEYKLPFLATVALLSLASCVSGPDHLVVRAHLPIFDGGRLRAQVKTTQETLALSIGSYKDGQSSLLDVQRSVATGQANLAQAAQHMAKNYVASKVVVPVTTSVEPRSGQLLMNTEPHAVAAMDKRWIISDNPPFGRVS